MSPWSPLPGELVIEADNEDCDAGVIVETNNGMSMVKWTGFIRPQTWANAVPVTFYGVTWL